MDPNTEIASNFTVGDYRRLRARLDPDVAVSPDWQTVFRAFHRRILERFLQPIAELGRYDDLEELPMRPGFAILALDCLLIDTLQSFREGRCSTGEVSTAASFRDFLRNAPAFGDFKSNDRADFFGDIRNGLLHNGETRHNWKIRIDTERLLTKDAESKTRTINRRLFHAGVLREYGRVCRALQHGDSDMRSRFLRRMDAICGIPPTTSSYFAYGSNLLDSEMKQTSPSAKPVGRAYIPAYRLVFDKHSITRGSDAANITKDASCMIWGFIYSVSDEERARLECREGGYSEILATALLNRADSEASVPVDVFTFISNRKCMNACGPSAEYLDLIVRGAKQRTLPADYIGSILAAASARVGS
jgi:hypothetical protein